MNTFAMGVLSYLLNSVWEAPAIFLAAWLLIAIVRRMGPQLHLEHRVWAAALVLEAVLPACHLQVGSLAHRLAVVLWGGGMAEGGGSTSVVLGSGSVYGQGVLRLPHGTLVAILVAYGASVLYFAVRLGLGVWRTAELQRRAEIVPLVCEAGRSMERCGRTFGVRNAVLATSPLIGGPVTVGVIRRVLLVPPEFLEEIAADDLEAAVAHEMAHMARRDFAKNVLYGLLTLGVAYHPVLWLTRSRVAESRELVCDALAAGALLGREKYARSLLRLAAMLAERATAAHRRQAGNLHAIGILGIFDANIFERRIMNLTQRRVEINGVRRMLAAAACVVVGLGTCASALALRMNVVGTTVASGEDKPAANEHAARVSGGVMAGNVVTRVNPVYPQDAKEAKITGAVVMHAVIGKDGLIEDLQVISGPEKLRDSALEAVRKWTYKPYLLNGAPTAVETTITVNYSLAP